MIRQTVAREAEIGDGATVGPYVSLRPGTRLAAGAHVGTFVEIKNAEIGEGAKVPHLSYVGDAEIGAAAPTSAPAPSPPTTTAAASTARRSAPTRASGRTRCSSRRSRWATARTPAPGAVVNRDVPPGALAKGVPGHGSRKAGSRSATTMATPRRRERATRGSERVALMELVIEEEAACSSPGSGNPELSRGDRRVPRACRSATVTLSTLRERRDLLPLRREHPRRRRVRAPEPLRADQRPHHGAAAS